MRNKQFIILDTEATRKQLKNLNDVYNTLYSKMYEQINAQLGIGPDKANIIGDLMHDSYIKLSRYCQTREFTKPMNYRGLIIFSAINEYKMKFNKSKLYVEVHFNLSGEDFESELNKTIYKEVLTKLEFNSILENDTKQYDDELLEICRLLFEYVKINYSEFDNSIFIKYFLSGNKLMSYKVLANELQISTSSVGFIIKNIKNDLKINLIHFIKTHNNEV